MNEETKQIMVVGEVREALQKMAAYLGEDPIVNLSAEALAKWNELQREYDAFYELSLDDRLIKSGMSKPLTNERNKER